MKDWNRDETGTDFEFIQKPGQLNCDSLKENLNFLVIPILQIQYQLISYGLETVEKGVRTFMTSCMKAGKGSIKTAMKAAKCNLWLMLSVITLQGPIY